MKDIICGYRGDPVCYPPDCGGACPKSMPDLRPIRSQNGDREKQTTTFILDRLSDDPMGWSNPENRTQALFILKLRKAKYMDDEIHKIITMLLDSSLEAQK